MIKKISLATLLTLTFLSAADSLKPMLQMGYDWGGTTLATVYHNSDYYYYDSEINEIRAGEGLSFEAGASLSNPSSNMELQFLIGYKFDSDSASNGEVTWDLIPFTALAMFKAQRWKFGGGVTYHLNPTLSGGFSGYENGLYFNDNVNDHYENAVGGVAQIQYMATDSLAIGLKGTFIEYELKNDSTQTAQGNSIGMLFSYTFGNERSEFR
ncbi:hypothetical protein KKC13_09985 [bacterium]|nr:hypothetical protein [bacterium]MBU1956940.1 hypothetical protein [bacterium]